MTFRCEALREQRRRSLEVIVEPLVELRAAVVTFEVDAHGLGEAANT
jgi:hypothetical protein